jgi:hypothetical protein
MVEGIREDFRRRPPANILELAQRFSKHVMGLLGAYDAQERSRSMGLINDMLQSSPLAQKSSTVNSSKARTEAGIECFRAADGALMVTPGQFTQAVDMQLRNLEGALTYSHHMEGDEYPEVMRRHQQTLAKMLDEVMLPLSGGKSGVELVGWGENYAFRHVGSNFYGSISWESHRPHPPGEDILYLREPMEDGRPFDVSKRMIDVMYADDAEGQRLGPERNERRFAYEILADLRRTIVSGDWTDNDPDAQERVWYAAGKSREILGLFESIHQPDYHAGQTDYLYSRMQKRPQTPTPAAARERYRFDWLDDE